MSVFPADFAILVAVAVVETCLAHAALPLCPQRRASSRGEQMATQTQAPTSCVYSRPSNNIWLKTAKLHRPQDALRPLVSCFFKAGSGRPIISVCKGRKMGDPPLAQPWFEAMQNGLG